MSQNFELELRIANQEERIKRKVADTTSKLENKKTKRRVSRNRRTTTDGANKYKNRHSTHRNENSTQKQNKQKRKERQITRNNMHHRQGNQFKGKLHANNRQCKQPE